MKHRQRPSEWLAVAAITIGYVALSLLVPAVLPGAGATPDKSLATYDRAKAVAYADQWASNGMTLRIPRYPSPSNGDDCTNFLSQMLYESGMPTIDAGTLNSTWHPDQTLLSWINVAAFENTFELAGRLTITSTNLTSAVTSAQPGDAIIYDWGEGKGFTHLAIVAGRGGFANYTDPVDGVSYSQLDGGSGDYIDQHVTDRYHAPWNYGYLTKSNPVVRAKMKAFVLHFNTPAAPPIPPASAPKVLVVGDSITQGLIGDYTWRYRLQQNFQATGTTFQYVGHRSGTYDMYIDPTYDAEINGTPLPDPNHKSPDPSDGQYRFQTSLPHDSQWGWTLASAKSQIGLDAKAYIPDYVVIALGFNDMAFGGSAAQAQQDLSSMVSTVRQYSPSVRIVVTTIIQRTPIPSLPSVNTASASYNRALAGFAASISTASSPVVVADVAAGYNANSDAYDGLHPNSIGEFKIARSIAGALRTVGLGTGWALSIPGSVDTIALATPQVWLENNAAGIKIHWTHIYGASAYVITVRSQTGTAQSLPLPLTSDWWLDRNVHSGTTYFYSVHAIRGFTLGPESVAASITASVGTVDGPNNANVVPGPGGTAISWPTVAGATSYKVQVYDLTTQAMTLYATSAPSLTVPISALVVGRQYAVGILSRNISGDGPAEGQPVFLAGHGMPATPHLSMKVADAADDTMTWTIDTSTVQTRMYAAYLGTQPFSTGLGRVTYPLPSPQATWVMPILPEEHGHSLFCVRAENGSLQTPCSNAVLAP